MNNRLNLFDKFINGSLNQGEQEELEDLLKEDDLQREFVEYTIETQSYVSMLKKLDSEPVKKVKKQPKVLRLLMLGAAAIIAVSFYLNLQKFRGFFLDGKSVSVNELINVEKEQTLTAHDGSRLFLEPGAQLEILSLKPVRIILHKGELKADIMPQKKSFEIIAGETITKVIGTEFKLLKNDSLVDLKVEEGKVVFGTEEKAMTFTAGQAGRVDENGLARLNSRYKDWYDWSRKYSKSSEVFVYLNFSDKEALNNISELTAGKIVFERRYGEYVEGRWPEKLALKDGGLESLANADLKTGQDFTVWSWTKLNTEKKIYPPILNADNPQWRLQFSSKGDFIHAGHNINVVDGEIAMKKEQWQFLAVTFSREITKTYVNGVFDKSMPGEDSGLIPKSIKIGFYKQFKLFRIFNGLIGEVGIQKGALSEQQIQEIYEATKP